MSTAPRTKPRRAIEYPTGDGKPMAETEVHLWVMMDLIQTLAQRYEADPMVYVGGDLLMYYEENSPNKRLAPDVFVDFGVPKLPLRDNYLIWEEGKPPDLVIEVTSKTTRRNDQSKKLDLYRDVLKVAEYFQFDPTEDYLRPAFQGFRLREGVYQPIEPVEGRLPSHAIGLHLARDGTDLRLFEPGTGRLVLTPSERAESESARAEFESARARAESARAEAESARARAESARADVAEAESERLRREIEELRRRLGGA